MATKECFGGPTVYCTGRMPRISLLVKMQQAEMFGKVANLLSQPEMKKRMIHMVIANILHMTNTIGNVLQHDEYYKDLSAYKAFDWSMQHFVQRMDSNMRYINVLRQEHPRTLNIFKLKTDLANLARFLKLIYDERLVFALEELKGCQKLLTIQEDVKLQHKFLSNVLARRQKNHDTFALYEASAMQEKYSELYETIDRCMDEQLVTDPINKRHRRDSLLADHACLEHKLMQTEEALSDEFENFYTKIQMDKYVAEKVLRFYYIQIEETKEKLGYWNWKYDTDYEKVINVNTNRKLKLQTLKKQWQDYIERKKFYRAEIDCIEKEMLLKKEEKENQDADLALQAVADAMQLKERKSSVKLKKKPKGKNGKNKQKKK